jgi:hypothetical protein
MAEASSEALGHEYEIVVNGQSKVVASATVTYIEIAGLAFPDKVGDPNLTFVITYRKAQHPHEGSLAEGGEVEVKHKGTIFNVTFTRRS